MDAGAILLTDPCYVVRDPGDYQYEPYRSWSGLVSRFDGPTTQITNEFGAEIGVVVTNFGGDGVFPVYVEMDPDTGRVVAAQIRFDGEDPR